MGVPGPSVGRRSFNYVYDSSVLAWIPESQPGGGGGGSGNSTVFQGTSPWVIAGNSTVVQGTTPWTIAGNSTVFQGGAPWSISGNSTVVPARASTVSRSSVTQSSTNVTLQAANTNRLGWTVYNRPTQGANLFLKFGATASTSDFDVALPANAYYEMPQPLFTGRIDGIWDSTGVGFARVCEWTP